MVSILNIQSLKSAAFRIQRISRSYESNISKTWTHLPRQIHYSKCKTEVDGWIILHTPTTNSAPWEGIIQVQSHFVHHNHNLVGKGNKASFWSAIWVGDSSIGKTGIASHLAAFIIYHVEGYGGAALWSPTFWCNLTDYSNSNSLVIVCLQQGSK